METKEIILPDGWEVKEVVGNKIIIREKEKELPKTWAECLHIVDNVDIIREEDSEIDSFSVSEEESCGCTYGTDRNSNLLPSGLGKSMLALCQLLICRNAWWKQLGWKPDWDKPDEKHCIVRKGEAADKQIKSFESCILAFPTYEVRDQFLDSFRDLIEEAKELL